MISLVLFFLKQSWAISQFFQTKFPNPRVYFPFLVHTSWEQLYCKIRVATYDHHVQQSSCRYRHHRNLQISACLLEPSPLPPQGCGGVQVRINRQLQQTAAFEAGLTGPLVHLGGEEPCPASERLCLFGRGYGILRGAGFISISQPEHTVTAIPSPEVTHWGHPLPLPSPEQLTLPSAISSEAALRKRTGPSQAFHQLSPGQSILYLGGRYQGKSKVSLQGVLVLIGTNSTNKRTKATTSYTERCFVFLFSWLQAKEISVVYTISDILYTCTHKKYTDLSTKG